VTISTGLKLPSMMKEKELIILKKETNLLHEHIEKISLVAHRGENSH
jgi:hypothetical protein